MCSDGVGTSETETLAPGPLDTDTPYGSGRMTSSPSCRSSCISRIAPQIGAGRKFFSAQYCVHFWPARIGRTAFADWLVVRRTWKRRGLTYGVQAETRDGDSTDQQNLCERLAV